MQSIERDKFDFKYQNNKYWIPSNKEFNDPEEWGDSTTGSFYWLGEYQTPTSVVEHNLERKINEKYNLLIEYFKEELDSVKSRFEQYNKVVRAQGKELNAMKKEMNLQKLDRIAAYQNNWNGEGTYKFDEEIISKAKFILLSTDLNRQPKIFPTNRNTIQIEYEDTNNKYLEVEILRNKFIVFTELYGEGNEYEVNSLDEVIKVMNEF